MNFEGINLLLKGNTKGQEKLAEVQFVMDSCCVVSQSNYLNNSKYCLNYNKFYQGHISHSFCGKGPFCSMKQVFINAFSDSSNAMLVLDGYVITVMKK